MFKSIPSAAKAKLWEHQREALDFAINHLKTYESPCLVRMPTGTGKTGVIGCLTRLSNDESSLVLTPWANLRQQMVSHIKDHKDSFWEKRGITPSPASIVPMFPSDAKQILERSGKKVIVSTFATLNAIRREHPETYKILSQSISLVVVDEGHYEPAVKWGKSVKGLKRRTVLLTATPYRNDLKLFQITNPKRSTYHFTHRDAVKRKIIRKLRLDLLASDLDLKSLSAAFAEAWKKEKRNKSLASPNPRAIVCCAKDEDITQVVSYLRKAKLTAIGIHEQFEKQDDKDLYKRVVPNPKKEKAEIWVHQNKLTEGLDDHRFCCVALFTRIRNDRKLIQQIGRVLRRNDGDTHDTALLLAPGKFSAEAEWRAYLEFETDLRLLDPKHFRNVVDTLLRAQPKVEYFDGRFRRRFQPSDLPHRPQVIIPPNVLVRSVGEKFSLEEYIKDCTDALNTTDAVILGPEINKPCQQTGTTALWVYASVRNSRFLQDTSLYEIKLETHCIVIADGFVFITDSTGTYPEECIEEHTRRVPAKILSKFLDGAFRPTNVSVSSSIPYDTVIKSADLRGHNLLNIAASLTDRLHICHAASGTSRNHGRRYVGMIRARLRQEVVEEERRSFEPEVFISWAKAVAKILNSSAYGSDLFHRYMPVCDPPSSVVPKIISVDMLRSDIELELSDGKPCYLGTSSSKVNADIAEKRTLYTCKFDLEGKRLKDSSISLRLEYQRKKARFWFTKHCGAAVQATATGENRSTTKSLAEYLNGNQDIVLIGLDDGETVYQGRNFYRIDYSFAESILLDLIVQTTGAPACNSEKGSREQIAALKRKRTKVFPLGSLFRAIAEQNIDLPFKEEVLVCTDIGTECADFVAANFTERKLALIHAKAGTGSLVSASAFHVIVAQAMKNLVYLTRSAGTPKGAGSWTATACWNKTKVSRLVSAKKGLPVGVRLWKKIKSDIINSNDAGLFAILVTTGCCDRTKLCEAAQSSAKRTPESAQLFHLLDGLNAYSRQLGVRLLIYNLPYNNEV